jgi:hypothetical protein
MSGTRRTPTILPPPSEFPLPMPEVPAFDPAPVSSDWRALLEIAIDTARPPSRRDSDRPTVPAPF